MKDTGNDLGRLAGYRKMRSVKRCTGLPDELQNSNMKYHKGHKHRRMGTQKYGRNAEKQATSYLRENKLTENKWLLRGAL